MDFIGFTLRSWIHEIFSHDRTVSPRLGNNYALKCSFDNFTHTMYTTMHGKRSELHCNTSLVSNCGEKVMKWRKTVEQIRPIVFLAFQTFSPGLGSTETSKCDSESFTRTVTYFMCVKNCQSYCNNLTHRCLPIARRLFYNVTKNHGPRI